MHIRTKLLLHVLPDVRVIGATAAHVNLCDIKLPILGLGAPSLVRFYGCLCGDLRNGRDGIFGRHTSGRAIVDLFEGMLIAEQLTACSFRRGFGGVCVLSEVIANDLFRDFATSASFTVTIVLNLSLGEVAHSEVN